MAQSYIPDHAVENAAATNDPAHRKSARCTIKLCLRNSANIPVINATDVTADIYRELDDFFIVVTELCQQEILNE